jgi:hypothetical protein
MNHLSLEWQKEGQYPLPEKVRLILHGGVPDKTIVDGEEVSWKDGVLEIGPFTKLKTILQ